LTGFESLVGDPLSLSGKPSSRYLAWKVVEIMDRDRQVNKVRQRCPVIAIIDREIMSNP
jgi:hypothetical protein